MLVGRAQNLVTAEEISSGKKDAPEHLLKEPTDRKFKRRRMRLYTGLGKRFDPRLRESRLLASSGRGRRTHAT